MSAVVETLKAARALLTPEGAWTQHKEVRFSTAKGAQFCALGAIQQSLRRLGDPTPCAAAVFHATGVKPTYVGNEHDALCVELVRWNDRPSRTQAQVLAAFDEAIRLAEAA